MVRAVLAELPYGDAQCLALHLVAGLNQAEVAVALGLTNSATRRRIIQGLQLFAQRYNAALASLGLSPEALAAVAPGSQPDPLEPGVAGYIPVEEQSTVIFGASQQPISAANSALPGAAESLPFTTDFPYHWAEPDAQPPLPIIVDAGSASTTPPTQEDQFLPEAALAAQDWSAAPTGKSDGALTQEWGWSMDTGHEWPSGREEGHDEEAPLRHWYDPMPFDREDEQHQVSGAESRIEEWSSEPEQGAEVEAVPDEGESDEGTAYRDADTPPVENAAELPPLPVRLVSVLTPKPAPATEATSVGSDTTLEGLDGTEVMHTNAAAILESQQPRVVPVLTPQAARNLAKTMPRPRGTWSVEHALDATGQNDGLLSRDEPPF
jgi:hypothetical protein